MTLDNVGSRLTATVDAIEERRMRPVREIQEALRPEWPRLRALANEQRRQLPESRAYVSKVRAMLDEPRLEMLPGPIASTVREIRAGCSVLLTQLENAPGAIERFIEEIETLTPEGLGSYSTAVVLDNYRRRAATFGPVSIEPIKEMVKKLEIQLDRTPPEPAAGRALNQRELDEQRRPASTGRARGSLSHDEAGR